MTGELFDVIGHATVLRHSIAPEGWDAAAFLDAVGDAMTRPERLAARLFSLRAGSLLNAIAGEVNRARLSGLLIGAELAAARPYWLGQNLAILGMGAQAEAYRDALASLGAQATLVNTERATLAGLTAAHRLLKETP
jgi:2-dehydro-3-deoxygalactonokinase